MQKIIHNLDYLQRKMALLATYHAFDVSLNLIKPVGTILSSISLESVLACSTNFPLQIVFSKPLNGIKDSNS